MADDQKFSKDVEVKEPRTMEQVEKQDSNRLANAYDMAKSGQQPQKPEQVNSQQVANTAPGMNGPNPPKNAKNAMAEQSHNKDMAKDDQRVQDAMDKMKAIKDRQEKTPEKGKDKGEPER
jgi:hypothetical protein